LPEGSGERQRRLGRESEGTGAAGNFVHLVVCCDDDSRSFYDEITHRRLSRIKARVDAGDLFRSNHPIKPAL
jgi:hypothetical protein